MASEFDQVCSARVLDTLVGLKSMYCTDASVSDQDLVPLLLEQLSRYHPHSYGAINWINREPAGLPLGMQGQNSCGLQVKEADGAFTPGEANTADDGGQGLHVRLIGVATPGHKLPDYAAPATPCSTHVATSEEPV